MDMKFVIPVKPRTKKNNQSFVTLKNGRTILLPSKAYREFEKNVVDFVKKNLEIETITNPINLKCLIYKEKDFKSDLVGYLQAIQDALVKAKVLDDDNTNIIKTTDGSKVFLDRNNPRIEVEITFY